MPRLYALLILALALPFTLTACDNNLDDGVGLDTTPAVGCESADAVVLPAGPTTTFLRTAPTDEADPVRPVRLVDLGLQPGDRFRAERLGEFQFRNIDPDSVRYGLLAVFSSDATLLDRIERERVPGAISAGRDYVSPPTHSRSLPTDIPEDFAVFDVDTLTVPEGSVYLFVSPVDDFYADNLDQDGDHRLCITHVE